MLKKTDPAVIQSYLEDSSNLSGGFADGLFLPENEKEIIEITKECSSKAIPLTTSGGTTGTTGGCIPFGGWILGTEKLNKIIDINQKSKTAIVQPAVTLDALDIELKKLNLLYPPDPTEATAFIGGTAATNASGSRSFKFGATRNWIKRIKVIFSTGETQNIERGKLLASKQIHNNLSYKTPNIKTSAGYYYNDNSDLIDLFIGSEGTLGIITEIEVNLINRFHDTFDIIAFFKTEKDAVDFAEQIKTSDILTLEFFDHNSLGLLRPAYPQIPENSGAAVYFEAEALELDQLAQMLEKHNVKLEESWLGTNDKQKEELRKFRHAMPEHINEEFKKHNTIKYASDIAVPDDKFREMLNYYNSQLTSHNSQLFWVKFGHIGQNHLHVNLVPKTQNDIPIAKETILKFVKKAVSLGGTCSAEHGIGKIKHEYLQEMFGLKGISEMVKIKKHFDPSRILNQGNIFPRELLK
ncbi:MAG: D-lactate dehydrogenase (cytochrome) [Candidatus Saganbacteria bacterium]|uniref:D-lactate dehydrogenase (cytochrome) n=1 Tax=Candidatus Saganbacteria bacterium TaxID=2575572 RepID=A0A833L196_UNCSA|nr:MAG: D-lactate dehydrogenase (cytochrome) [Candidatus Saganbacteria bacterium]